MNDKENSCEQKTANLNWTSEFTLHRMLREEIVGELSEELLPSKGITWEIPNYFEITEEIDHYIYSPVFSLANSVWCLQMFPNGQKVENSNGWIDLLLVRLYFHDAKHLVWYKLGIKTCHGKVYESFADFNIFKGKDLEWGVACLLKRSRTFDNEELIAKDGVFRAFCEIQVVERQASTISKQPVSSKSAVLIKIPDHLKVGKLSEELFSTKDILWKIPDAFTLLEERTCHIVSPSFDFENSTWFLQVYLIEEKAEKNDTWFGLKLVRLNSSVLKHDIYYTLGIKDRFGKIYDSFSGKYIFGGKAVNWKSTGICILKTYTVEKCTDIAPLGCITAFCSFNIKKTVGELAELPLKSQSDEKTKIRFHSGLENSREFTWEISNFFQLPVNEGYFIDSEEFPLANAHWCLRLYPNGKKGDRSGWICLVLVRRNSCYSEHHIHYKLGLKTQKNRKHETLIHAVTFHGNAAEMGVVNLIKRSDVLKSRKTFAKNDVLRAFCEILIIEKTVPLSDRTELFKPSTDEFVSDVFDREMSRHAQQLCLQSSLSDPEIYIWKIKDFLEQPEDDGFYMESAEFSVANATWCMRMYPNGLERHDKEWIQLFLVRLSSSNPEHRIHYRLGIKTRGVKEHGTLIHDVTFRTNGVEMGVVNLLKKSELIHRKRKLLVDGILIVFCHIYMIQDFRVKASNTLPEKQLEPSSNTDITADELKQDNNFASPYEELKSITQDMVSKNKVNISTDAKDVYKDLEELDFTLLKKKKKKKRMNSLERECPINQKDGEGNLGIGTGPVTDAIVDLKQSENCASTYKELKNYTQAMVSKHEVYNLADQKDADTDFEELNCTLLKKKMNFSLEIEYPSKVKGGETNLDRNTDHGMGTLNDKKEDERNSSLLEKLKSNTKKTDSKDHRNITRDGSIIDKLNLIPLKKKIVAKPEAECPIKEKKDEKESGIGKIQQHCNDVPFCEKDCDVRFFVRGEEFHADSAILKDQSTFFASVMKLEAMKSPSLVVIDNSPPEVFKIFLQYLYSGQTKILTTENVFSLYSIANKYSMQKLRTECLLYVKNILSVDTICDIMAFSLQEKEMAIVEFATDFFTKNVTEIIATSKWQKFLKDNFTSANELLIKVLKK